MPVKRYPIPERFSSVVSPQALKKIDDIKARKVSGASIKTVDSDISEILEAKIQGLEADLAITTTYRQGLIQAFEHKRLAEDELQEENKEIDDAELDRKGELVVLRQQKKILTEDLQEHPKRADIEQAYVDLMVSKVLLSTAKQSKRNFDQSGFKKAVLAYYGIGKKEIDGKMGHCAVLGWLASDQIKAAHIVPKALEGSSLSYLYGVGEAVLSDPRNGTYIDSLPQSYAAYPQS
jgi:hypothetical protein